MHPSALAVFLDRTYKWTWPLLCFLRLQVAGGRQTLALCLEFTPSVALYIRQSLRKVGPAVKRYEDVVDVWECAAEICCTEGCIGASLENFLSVPPALLAVDPLQTIPVDRLLYDDPSSPPDLLMLPQVDPPTRLLLLFAQLLAAVAAERNTIIPRLTPKTTRSKIQGVLRSTITTRLQQLTDISCCSPILLTDPVPYGGTSDALQLLTRTSKHVTMLRSLVLFLKLATLTFSVRADLNGNIQMPLLVQSLWRTILNVAASISEDLTVMEEDGSFYVKVIDSQQEQTLCVVLYEHTVAMLRRALREPQAELPRRSCLRLLAVLAEHITPELLRHEVKNTGKE